MTKKELIEEATMAELKSLERQKEEWIAVCGHIKDIITEYDYVSDEPLALITSINNILDTAFCYMPDAMKILNGRGK